jgi:uncharacterized membrane protein YjjB (DUF3815 family)
MLGTKLAAIVVMSAAIGVLYRVPRSVLLYGGLNGIVAWLIIYSLSEHSIGIVSASFFGSLAVGIISEMFARSLRKPATVFVIPGFIPLVPGRDAYTTMRYLVEGQYLPAMTMGVQTLFTAGAIAFGIFVGITSYRLIVTYKWKSENKHADKS